MPCMMGPVGKQVTRLRASSRAWLAGVHVPAPLHPCTPVQGLNLDNNQISGTLSVNWKLPDLIVSGAAGRVYPLGRG